MTPDNTNANSSSDATYHASGPVKSGSGHPGRGLFWLAVGMVVVGLAIIGVALTSMLQPQPLPYERTTSKAEPASYQAVTLPEAKGAKPDVERVEWHTPNVRGPVAASLIMRENNGRVVPLDWQNFVTDPVFFADLSIGEVSKVMAAIRKHVSEDAVVLSWWDLSRKIHLIAGRQAPLDDSLARGLQIPAAWSDSREAVQREERAFWGKTATKSASDSFSTFIDALANDEEHGAEVLRSLGANSEVFIAVHLSDIWKLAASRPNKIGIAYRDFPSAGLAHGVIKTVRQWIADNKMTFPYAIEPIGNAVRVHYFTDGSSSNTLLAKLLPFSESNPLLLKNFELVYQHRGFWIYKLRGAEPRMSTR